MTNTWYEACFYGNKIEPIEVERFTDVSVWIDGRRRSREGVFFPTQGEAIQFVRNALEQKLAHANRQVSNAQQNLIKFNEEDNE